MSELWSQSSEEKKIAGIYIRVSTEDQARFAISSVMLFPSGVFV